MGYRKVVINGEEYKLTPKWYKEYLSAIELWKKAKKQILKISIYQNWLTYVM